MLLFALVLITMLTGSCANQEKAEVRQEEGRLALLQEAVSYLGVCSPEEAVALWVRGLMERNAAMQFSVMSEKLKQRYMEKLEQSAPGWVTGVSSPWVSGYRITDISETAEGLKLYSLEIQTETSTGPAQSYLAVLVLNQEGSYWRIAALSLDEELGAYTGGIID
jgi:hypothetical protein